jgi:hypothetical protein
MRIKTETQSGQSGGLSFDSRSLGSGRKTHHWWNSAPLKQTYPPAAPNFNRRGPLHFRVGIECCRLNNESAKVCINIEVFQGCFIRKDADTT